MKHLLLSIIFVSFLIPVSGTVFPYPEIPSKIKDPQKKTEYFARHFWDDSGIYSGYTPDELEQVVADYVTVIDAISLKKADSSLKRFLKFTPYKDVILPLLEKYLYDVESPLRNDALYAKLISRTAPAGEKELLHQIMTNTPGTGAPDFLMSDRSGDVVYLSDIIRDKPQTLLFFYDDSCSHCIEIIAQIKSSAPLAYLCALGALNLVCINVSEEAIPISLPQYCVDTVLSDDDFYTEGKYFFRSMPSFFLIGNDGIILLKETNLNEALTYCSESQNIKIH